MRLILTTLTLLLFMNSYAQLTSEWTFRNNEAYNFYPTTNLLTIGNHTYVCSQSIDVNNSAYIFRIDDSGNQVNYDSIQSFAYSILNDRRMVAAENGHLYVCGNVEVGSLSKIRLIKYDSLLNRVWDQVINDTSSVEYEVFGIMYSQVDSAVCLIGSRFDTMGACLTMKLDGMGQVLWENYSLSSSQISVIDYDIDQFGSVVVGGHSSDTTGEDMTICKINSLGNVDWIHTYDGSNHSDDALMDLCLTDQNNIATVNRFEDSIPIKIMIFDSYGVLKWNQDMGEYYLPAITTDKAGSVYVATLGYFVQTECIIHKYDSMGNFIKQDSIDIPYYNSNLEYFVSLQTDDSANVYVLQNADSSSDLRWCFSKMDSTLNVQYAFVYPDSIPNPSTASSLLLNNKGFVIAGAVNNYSELRVVQFSENIQVSTLEIPNDNSFAIWPNPSRDQLNFKLQNDNCERGYFIIYDLNGREVMNVPSQPNELNTINVGYLNPGSYFYHFITECNSYKGLFIKM